MKEVEHERRDWIMISLILLLGLACVIAAAQRALRFSPEWELAADMASRIDPNSDFLTRRPDQVVEPIDASILTQPGWVNVFLTPGAAFVTGTPFPARTATAVPSTPSILPLTNTAAVTNSPTSTFAPLPWIPSPTLKPADTDVPTATFTQVPTQPSTLASAETYTSTPAETPTPTPTNTPDPTEPDFAGADGNTAALGNGVSIEFDLSGFLLDGNSTYDVIYYEKEESSSAGKIHLGAVLIEVYDETTGAWYAIYHWGDGIVDTSASYNNGNSEPDGFPVDMTVLSGTPPLNTGIALDIDAPATGLGGALNDAITKIRITSFSGASCEVDALQMLR